MFFTRRTYDAQAGAWLFAIASGQLASYVRRCYAQRKLATRLGVQVPTASASETEGAAAPRPPAAARPHTSHCDPMSTVRSRGRTKYSTGSVASRAVARNRRLRHLLRPGAGVARSSILERK